MKVRPLFAASLLLVFSVPAFAMDALDLSVEQLHSMMNETEISFKQMDKNAAEHTLTLKNLSFRDGVIGFTEEGAKGVCAVLGLKHSRHKTFFDDSLLPYAMTGPIPDMNFHRFYCLDTKGKMYDFRDGTAKQYESLTEVTCTSN